MGYSVVVVDDEIHAVQHLRRMLESAVPPCTVTGAFTDAREALGDARTHAADIVIADIMMPVMNGLDFAREHLARYPHAKVVLLTAYRDFEFAKQALGIGVFDYWVKHELRAHNILAHMQAVMAAVDEENRIRQSVDMQGLLETLGGGGSLPALFPETDGPCEYFLACLSGGGPCWPQLAGVALTGTAALVNLRVVAGRVSGRDRQERLGRFRAFCRELEHRLPGGGALLSDLLPAQAVTPALHRRCLAAAGNRRFGDRGVVVAADGLLELLQPDLPVQLRMEQEYFAPMADCVRNMDLPALLRDLGHLWREPVLAAGNLQALAYARGMLWELAQNAGAEEAPPPAEAGPEELALFFSACFRRVLEPADSGSASAKVRKICAYISQNYSGDLRLKTLTGAFAISGDYLRKLFKDETGQTLSEYITRVRIGKAKELLRTGDYKIYEIAELVGYHSAQYFSQAFYNATGRYPTDPHG